MVHDSMVNLTESVALIWCIVKWSRVESSHAGSIIALVFSTKKEKDNQCQPLPQLNMVNWEPKWYFGNHFPFTTWVLYPSLLPAGEGILMHFRIVIFCCGEPYNTIPNLLNYEMIQQCTYCARLSRGQRMRICTLRDCTILLILTVILSKW
jgi:hypothetical protein